MTSPTGRLFIVSGMFSPYKARSKPLACSTKAPHTIAAAHSLDNKISYCGLRNRQPGKIGIPKALWKPIYDAARSVIAGDTRTLVSRRDEAIKAFSIFGVTPDMIYQALGIKGIQDVSIEHMVTLKGLLTAIQEGDTTPEQAFAPPSSQDQHLAGKAAGVANGIKERYAATKPASSGGAPAVSDRSSELPPATPTQEPGQASQTIDFDAQKRRADLKEQEENLRRRGRKQEKLAAGSGSQGVALNFNEG
jgi:hypothetical protein